MNFSQTKINVLIEQHHYLNNSVDTAAASIKAGCNLELGSDVFKSQLDAMKAGMNSVLSSQ